ncbi:indolepyruvate decarboxylase [Plantibacter sp. VKM Ac-1784]|uniref:Alpha-keto-acid decarboxylase n=1 Tax=Plantibacter elymi (nom. nud.) TaxID=199708 RepID=A0ABY1RDY7_9MICO|nr:thiamine pyrophosphate-binding protein [Plantibacter sp. VKM Ac-1784]SMQ71164.1 indolepyruvate decarboxylase [Plantibacter sp. VKM Ac-1784]
MTLTDGHVSVGQYLATRLLQLGVRHVFGLPGDFNLNLLDEMSTVQGVEWVGSSNELNAAYSADGYARVGRRAGALVTTFGVGELSALNGIAGSFAEQVPVIHIGGLPARASMASGAPLHHTLLDGDYGHFVRMFREVTVADAVIDPDDAAQEIDRLLVAMISASKPVYLGVPLDVANAPVAAASLDVPLAAVASDPQALSAFTSALTRHLANASSLVVLAGPDIHRRGIERDVAALAELPGISIASQSGSKAILDETHRSSLGTYLGATTRSAESRDRVDDAEHLVMIGTTFSDFTTGFFTHRYDPSSAVELALDHARIGHAVYRGVRLDDTVRALHAAAASAPLQAVPATARAAALVSATATATDDSALTHDSFWPQIQGWLQPDTTIAAEAGTAFYGVLDLDIPERSDLMGQPIWSSIGFTLPATFGAMLARPDRRPVLFIGDGSAQLTIQELGHLYAYGRNPVVFLLDNDGYTVERKIQSPDASYQDIVRWNWDLVPAAFGADQVTVLSVSTPAELQAALSSTRTSDVGAFIRVVLPKYDAPRLLEVLARGISEVNKH